MSALESSGWRHGEQPANWLVNSLLAVGVTVAISVAISADVDRTQPNAWAYVWAVGFGALMFLRQRYPVLVLALSLNGLIAYYATGQTVIGLALPVAAAVFSAAEAGRLVQSIVGSVTLLIVTLAYRLLWAGHDPAYVLGYDLPQNGLILAAAIALGDGVRSRRELRRQLALVGQLTARQVERDAEARAVAERLAISRDLHDSMGHALAVIALHSEIARERAQRDRGAADALDVVRNTTSTALAELRRTVAGLRRGEAPARVALGFAALESAVEAARAAGVTVTVVNEAPSGLGSWVENTVYRIVQESVTNIMRHSDASAVRVHVGLVDRSVRVRVTDNGTVVPGGDSTGHGLVGMRERVEALGGVLRAGPGPAGFEVEAVIPWEEQ